MYGIKSPSPEGFAAAGARRGTFAYFSATNPADKQLGLIRPRNQKQQENANADH
jgi:hypothetical protein